MPKFVVKGTSRVHWRYEIEAPDESSASEQAVTKADHDFYLPDGKVIDVHVYKEGEDGAD